MSKRSKSEAKLMNSQFVQMLLLMPLAVDYLMFISLHSMYPGLSSGCAKIAPSFARVARYVTKKNKEDFMTKQEYQAFLDDLNRLQWKTNHSSLKTLFQYKMLVSIITPSAIKIFFILATNKMYHCALERVKNGTLFRKGNLVGHKSPDGLSFTNLTFKAQGTDTKLPITSVIDLAWTDEGCTAGVPGQLNTFSTIGSVIFVTYADQLATTAYMSPKTTDCNHKAYAQGA